ncbi:MAG: hypothetical protein J7M38_10290, partial [Armatimonadetes bacterium]|nr:hypothetical protein [Armatimonadota bacterium]
TPETARYATYIGGGYFVMSLNFRRLYEFTERGVKVLGQLSIPPFEPTSKPITVNLTLSAFGARGGMLGSSTITLKSIPYQGALVPFETRLYDVSLDELSYVMIIPKGAWTVR